MHEVIQHVGIVSCLDCWRIEARKNTGIQTLDEFASSKPSWAQMQEMANQLALEQVATSDSDMTLLSDQLAASRDYQRENILCRQQYFLLYEEISHALNAGNIGHIETCFIPWSYIFQGCSKHKYAAELRRYLKNVHFIYPKGLAYMPSHWGCVDSDLGIGSQQERNQNEYSLQSHREEGQILSNRLAC